MKRLAGATGAAAVLIGLAVAAPAGAEPQQGATSAGTLTLRVTQSGDSRTWGPWQFTGVWKTDDNASFAGRVSSAGVTTTPPTPSSVIPDFTISGSNRTGSLDGTCSGSATQPAAKLLEVTIYCVDRIAGASLAGEDPETIVLAAVHRRSTQGGVVTTYRGAW